MPTHKSSDYKLSAVKYYFIFLFGRCNYTNIRLFHLPNVNPT